MKIHVLLGEHVHTLQAYSHTKPQLMVINPLYLSSHKVSGPQTAALGPGQLGEL